MKKTLCVKMIFSFPLVRSECAKSRGTMYRQQQQRQRRQLYRRTSSAQTVLLHLGVHDLTVAKLKRFHIHMCKGRVCVPGVDLDPGLELDDLDGTDLVVSSSPIFAIFLSYAGGNSTSHLFVNLFACHSLLPSVCYLICRIHHNILEIL